MTEHRTCAVAGGQALRPPATPAPTAPRTDDAPAMPEKTPPILTRLTRQPPYRGQIDVIKKTRAPAEWSAKAAGTTSARRTPPRPRTTTGTRQPAQANPATHRKRTSLWDVYSGTSKAASMRPARHQKPRQELSLHLRHEHRWRRLAWPRSGARISSKINLGHVALDHEEHLDHGRAAPVMEAVGTVRAP